MNNDDEKIIKVQSYIRQYLAKKKKNQLLRDQSYHYPILPTNKKIIDQFKTLIPNINAEKDILLDIGCGDGKLCYYFNKLYQCQCIGIEYNKNVLKKNISLNNITLLQDTIYNEELMKQLIQQATIIYIYMLPKTNQYLSILLEKYCLENTFIICYVFKLPNWSIIKELKITSQTSLYLYKMVK